MRASISAPIALALLTACAGSGSQTAALPSSAQTKNAGPHSPADAPPVVTGCQIFPTPPPSGPTGNNWWNQDISTYPLDPNSANYIKALPGNLHPDFGHESYYGIPFNVVPADQPKVPIIITNYPSSSNPGPYPIPPNAQVEGGRDSTGDRHVLVLQKGTCTLYEMWRAFPVNGGTSWKAGVAVTFDLHSNKLRPNGWTSADAAGLPIMPALVKCAEVAAGAIDHPLRVTFQSTQAGFIHPATHYASSSTDPNLPPMGLRLRLKASYDISHFNRVSQIILTAMKRYGMFVADNGSNWFFQGQGGSAAKCWNNNQLDQLKSVPGSAFEAVETGPILR
jgi:hypothetical protein